MPMLSSMTGFGRATGTAAGRAFAWELRSVNGRGLDIRLKLPPGLDAQEPALRERIQSALRRGTIQANLTLQQDAATHLAIHPDILDRWLELARQTAARIPGAPAPRAEALLALPGVIRQADSDQPIEPAIPAILATFANALAALVTARQSEGARLHHILATELDGIELLVADATRTAADQPQAQLRRLRENLATLLANTSTTVSDDRLAQELALLATRADIKEELDRLASHIAAARALLADATNIGRRLDFLVQEFNREANTLCSKSASTALTTIGLRLKAAIEQLREQVQNIE